MVMQVNFGSLNHYVYNNPIILGNCSQAQLKPLVSWYENDFDTRRSADEEPSNQVLEITVNVPNLGHYETVVSEAIALYCLRM